jgi:hypothetical protein
MNRKLILALPLVIAGMLAITAPAHALCPVDDPTCGPGGGGSTTVTRTLHVVDSTQATLTGTGISCGVGGDDCTQSFTYDVDADPPTETLTAGGVPAGYTARIFSCTSSTGSSCSGTESLCGIGSCTADMSANLLVRMSVADETPPSTATISGPDKVGPTVRHFTASATDGAGVASYRYYLDGVDQGLSGAGYDVPVDALPAGPHTLTARARDAAGNESNALSAPKSFVLDKSTGLTGVTTTPAFTKSPPNVAFTPPADVASVACDTKLGGAQVGSTSACTSPYAPQGITTDGLYSVEILVTDDVGNQATVTRTFTLDRGAPNLTVTSPANGAVVGGPFSPSASGTDGFSSVTFDCKLDGGAFGSCASLAPTDGAHTVTVRASDLAGNTTEEQRSFTYDSHAPVVNITGGPGEGSVVYSRSTAFTFTTSDLTTVTRSCQLDGGAFGACTSATGESLSGLGLGIHTFTLRAVDAAGHTTTAQRRFTVADKPADSGGGSGGTGGTTGGSGGTTGGSGGPTVKTATLTVFWRLFGKQTRVDALTLEGVHKGAKVTVTCKGKGCAFKQKTLTATGAKIKLAKSFKKRKLAAKTVITITLADATGTKRFRYTLRAGKFPKKSIK